VTDPAQAAFTDLHAAIVKERAARKANDLAAAAANDAMKALGEAVNYRERCKARLLELAEKPPAVVEATGVEHVRSLAPEPRPAPASAASSPLPNNPRRKG
jgi:hypothetical protein